MAERCKCVEACIEEARNIREEIDKLCRVQDKSLVLAMGFSNLNSSESDTGSEIDDTISPPGFSTASVHHR